MKNLKAFMRFLKSNPVFKGEFENSKDVFAAFEEPEVKNYKIVYAYYECECYDGNAVVFYYDTKTRKYYETYGSHCSCYGLEGQWDGTEINFPAMQLRMEKGYWNDGNIFKNLYLEFLNKEVS